MEIQPEIKEQREGKRERHGAGSQIPKKPGRETSPRNWSHPLLFRRPFILLIKYGDQWVTQNYVASATQILSVYYFVYKRSQVIYIIFWPRGLLKLFGSLP